MSTQLYQCAVSITSTDGSVSLDTSNMEVKSTTIQMNQKNRRYRGVGSESNNGYTMKEGLDKENTLTILAYHISTDDLMALNTWFLDKTDLNISIVYKEGPQKGLKMRLSSWVLKNFPIQETLDDALQTTTITLSGYSAQLSQTV